jgi:aryl-alcohol dehydrogenase-like predicted oxidoreductase
LKYLDFASYDSALHIAKLSMGSTMSMDRLDKNEVFRLYDRYREAGGNCFDTARYYQNGRCEETLCEYIQSRNIRHDIVISSKGGHPHDDAPGKSRLAHQDLMKEKRRPEWAGKHG